MSSDTDVSNNCKADRTITIKMEAETDAISGEFSDHESISNLACQDATRVKIEPVDVNMERDTISHNQSLEITNNINTEATTDEFDSTCTVNVKLEDSNTSCDEKVTISEHLPCVTNIKKEPIKSGIDNIGSSLNSTDASNTLPGRGLVDYLITSDDELDGEPMDALSTAPTERGRDVEIIIDVNKDKPEARIDVNSSNEDEPSADSSSDSSDSESSSSDSSSSAEEVESEAEEEDESGKSNQQKPKQKAPSKETNAAVQEKLPIVVYRDFVLPEDVVLAELGHVNSIIGQLVVVQSKPETPALNLDSILFKENRHVVGAVYDVFGPVVCPLYSIVFNDAADISTHGIALKMPVFYAPHLKDITAYVFTDKLRNQKGSDASWKNDDEPPVECLDYSDDEKERDAKNRKQEGKEGRRRKKPQRRERGNPSYREEENKRQQHQQQKGNHQQWSRNGPPQNNERHHRRPPFQHGNGQFGGDRFQNNPGHPQNMPPPICQAGNQFPPRLEHVPRHPPPPPPPPPPGPLPMFPPRPPGFMGDQPPLGPFHNNPLCGNQGPPIGQICGPDQFKEERPFPIHQGPFEGLGGPVQNGGFPRPMNAPQDAPPGMLGGFGGMWQTPPLAPPPPPPPPLPPPSNGNLRPPPGLPGHPQIRPPHMQPPSPNFPVQFPNFPPPPPPPPPQSDLHEQLRWQKQRFPPPPPPQ